MHANGDQMIAGAVQASRRPARRPGKDIFLTGYGGTREGFTGIRDGSWFASVNLYPQTQARKMVEFATAGRPRQAGPARRTTCRRSPQAPSSR